RWHSLCGDGEEPTTIGEAEALYQAFAAFQPVFARLQNLLAPGLFTGLSLNEIEHRLSSLANDSITPHRIPRVLAIERELEECGVGAIVGEIRSQRQDPALWPQVFEFAWLSSCLDAARAAEPVLASFSGRRQDELIEEFRQLDRESLKMAVAKVRRLHAEHAVAAM
ncbi:hypothetical protein B1A_13821, partial [mine drainage metagenome]